MKLYIYIYIRTSCHFCLFQYVHKKDCAIYLKSTNCFRFRFLCLMTYQLSWVINCQSHPSKRIAVMLFNPLLWGLGGSYFPNGICPKVKVIAGQDFKLAYYHSAVHRFNHDTTRKAPQIVSIYIYIPVCLSLSIWIYHRAIGLKDRVFANGLRDRGSNTGRVIQKMLLHASLLIKKHYKVRIKGKGEQSGNGVVSSPSPRCCS